MTSNKPEYGEKAPIPRPQRPDLSAVTSGLTTKSPTEKPASTAASSWAAAAIVLTVLGAIGGPFIIALWKWALTL